MKQTSATTWVLEELNYKKNGYFIELGAADGVNLSNTIVLEKKYKWDGICIEPLFFKELLKNRNCKCVNLCVGEKQSEVEFYKTGLGSGVISSNSRWKNRKEIKESNIIKVKTDTLENILDANRAPRQIDFLSLDVEGMEETILKSFPFEKYIINLIVVEINHSSEENIKKILEKNNYEFIKQVDIDDYFKRK